MCGVCGGGGALCRGVTNSGVGSEVLGGRGGRLDLGIGTDGGGLGVLVCGCGGDGVDGGDGECEWAWGELGD